MIVYMDHPKHGTHIAYSEDEVKACEANGWRVRPKAAHVPAPEAIEAAQEADKAFDDAPEDFRPRRGRPRKVN